MTHDAGMLPSEAVDETFLGVLAHELRTPVTTIYAGASLLSGSRLPATTRRAITAEIVAEAERLYRLVEDLLVLGRLDVGSLDAERVPVAIGRTALEAIEREVVLAGDLRITYSGPRDMAADAADPYLLMHVMRNLLDNAVRVSLPQALIEVVVEGSRDEVSVRVLDQAAFAGRGGPDAFEIAASPPATPAQRAGAGLGLVVVRRLVAVMGGRVWAAPRRTGGNEFGFALPRAHS